MRARLTLILLLGVVLVTLVAFAHASPPDATWLPGVYDAADFDDVVDFLVSLSAATPDSPPSLSPRLTIASAAVVIPEPGELPPRRLRSDGTRSPPSA
ncbi:MAG TPA: hypothetical protein VKV41_15155 [Methylomirabilota bacterium]|jgi:hypothetical protein|nr:hypothetical protein [Methylomirabilota bacterium]